MQTTFGVLAFVLALAAAIAATYTLLQPAPVPSELAARLDAVEARLRSIEDAAPEDPAGRATLQGREPSSPGRTRDASTPAPSAGAGGRDGDQAISPFDAAREASGLEEMVDEAVAKKAAELQWMQANKKPPIEDFARVLELGEDQRREAEEAIVQSQHEIQAILEMPAADGTVFMDELVEIFARSMAEPEQDPTRFQSWVGRLLSEEIPGTSDTYAGRVEAVKKELRDTFRRSWSGTQYAAFEAWQMDPTEVQGIPGSPWKEIERRVIERARDLGAELPADD